MAPTATGPSPAASSTGNTNGNSTALPGSLEEATARYTSIKNALKTGLAHKRTIDRSLIDLESQIYLFEGSYLQSTAASGGNIVKGFDSYLKNSSSSSSAFASGAFGGNSKRAAAAAAEAAILDIPLEDRIFSLSSATYARSLELKANETGNGTDGPDDDEEEQRQAAAATKKSKKDKEGASAAASVASAAGEKTKKKKSEAGTPLGDTRKDREGSAQSTPSSMPKLKRKNADGSSVTSGGGKASTKRKKDDD